MTKPVKALQAFIVVFGFSCCVFSRQSRMTLMGLLSFINRFLNQLQYLMLIFCCNLI